MRARDEAASTTLKNPTDQCRPEEGLPLDVRDFEAASDDEDPQHAS